jgi:hypothetical protein
MELGMNDSCETYRVTTQLMVHAFDGDPDEITTILGVEPTSCCSGGDSAILQDGDECGQCRWVKESPANPCRTTLQESVAALLTLFPDVFAFARLPHPARIEVKATLVGFRQRPYFFLSTQHVAMLAVIGADVHLDFGVLGEADTSTDEGRLATA